MSPHCDIFKCRKTAKLHAKNYKCKSHTAPFLATAFSFSSFHFSHYWDFESRQLLFLTQKTQHLILMLSRIESMLLNT